MDGEALCSSELRLRAKGSGRHRHVRLHKAGLRCAEDPPDYDEILEAKQLFEEALSYLRRLPDGEDKRVSTLIVEHHWSQAEDLLSRRR